MLATCMKNIHHFVKKKKKEKKQLGKEREEPFLSLRAAWEGVISLSFCSEAN